eukprot:Gb_07309 [translate_table: standard]
MITIVPQHINFEGLRDKPETDLEGFVKGEIAIGIWKALGCKNPHAAIANLSLKQLIREISNVRWFKCCNFENVVPVESLVPMKNLQFLWLENLQIFNGPEKVLNVSACQNLEAFDVSDCESLTELPGLGSLNFLTEMKLWDCGELEQMPTLPTGLVKARIARCSRLKRISFNMSQMKELKVLNVKALRSFDEVFNKIEVMGLHGQPPTTTSKGSINKERVDDDGQGIVIWGGSRDAWDSRSNISQYRGVDNRALHHLVSELQRRLCEGRLRRAKVQLVMEVMHCRSIRAQVHLWKKLLTAIRTEKT